MHNWTASGDAHRESHPSEDLSELPPLLESVAGQGYHCRRTGSWRGLPKPVRFGWVHARFLKGRLFMQKSAQEGLGASARRCPFRGPSAKVIQLPDMKLSKNTGGKFTPLLSIPKNSQVTKRFLKFFLDLSWSLLFGIGRHGNHCSPSPNNGQKSVNHTPLSKIF